MPALCHAPPMSTPRFAILSIIAALLTISSCASHPPPPPTFGEVAAGELAPGAAAKACSNSSLRSKVYTRIYQTGCWLAVDGEVCAGEFCYRKTWPCGQFPPSPLPPEPYRIYAWPYVSGATGRGYVWRASDGRRAQCTQCNCAGVCSAYDC